MTYCPVPGVWAVQGIPRDVQNSGVFIASEMELCVLELELSFWILDQATKNPTPKVMHAPVVDFMSASIAAVIRGGRSALSLSGMSRTDFAKAMRRSSLLSSSVVGHVTCLCSSLIVVAKLG
jgi:hypothetical protein